MIIKIIFTSLQVLRNTYNYSLEKTNIMSKNTYNLFFLWFFLILNMQNILFNYFFKWKLSLKRIKFKFFKLKKITFYINQFYFFSQTWFLLLFSLMAFNIKNIKKLKKKKNFNLKSIQYKKILFL